MILVLVCFFFFFFSPILFHSSRGWSRWVPGIKKMPTEVAVSRPGARPTLNTPKKEKRKHKINQQNKTKRKKKFRSFSSSLAETHNSLCVTDVTVGKARAQKAASPPAPCRWRRRYCCTVSPAGRAPLPLTPFPPPVQWGLSLYNMEDGQKEGEGLSGRQGRSWARESEEGHCSAVEVFIISLDLHCCWATYRIERATGVRIPDHRNPPDPKGTH